MNRNANFIGGSVRTPNTQCLICGKPLYRRPYEMAKVRFAACVRCGSVEHLESHHVVELADLIERLGIKSRDDARKHAAMLWDLDNGITLCEPCHYVEHGRTRRESA